MLTGRYMHVLGHRTQTHLLQAYEQNYFATMKKNGYWIQYYGKNDVFSPDAMNTSVSYWEGDIGVQSGGNAYEYGEAGYWSMLSTGANVSKDDMKNKDYAAVVKSVSFLKNQTEDSPPFVLFIPGRGAHPPYGSPMEFHNKFSVEDVKNSGRKLRPAFGPTKPRYHSKDQVRRRLLFVVVVDTPLTIELFAFLLRVPGCPVLPEPHWFAGARLLVDSEGLPWCVGCLFFLSPHTQSSAPSFHLRLLTNSSFALSSPLLFLFSLL
tara:strand:+ start:361 stop:1152 length:792 start_codon:yes stop_codon:yes gene_type:complete